MSDGARSCMTGERPEARQSFGMAYDQARREVVVFGGLSANGRGARRYLVVERRSVAACRRRRSLAAK